MSLKWEHIPGENARQAFRAYATDDTRVEATVMRRRRVGHWKWMLRINDKVEVRYISGKDFYGVGVAQDAAEYIIGRKADGPQAYAKAIQDVQAAVDRGTLESLLMSVEEGFGRL